MSTHFPTDLSETMQTQNTEKQQVQQPLVSFNLHPGFLCFFKDFVDQKGWTFYQCYQSVAKSSHQLMKIKNPIQTILNDPQKSKQQKLKQLQLRSQSNSLFAYLAKKENKSQDSQIECFIIEKQKKAIKNIQLLNNKLNDLQKIKKKVIDTKKKQFIFKQKQREKEMKKLMEEELKEKERRANKVREIQEEVELQNKKKLMLKLKQQQENPQSQNSCQIM